MQLVKAQEPSDVFNRHSIRRSLKAVRRVSKEEPS
jgi:hypothetical protein